MDAGGERIRDHQPSGAIKPVVPLQNSAPSRNGPKMAARR